ncbi:protein NLP1-like [Nicotiana tabacum]|uniref:Protein NLP1-like n=1 Tax=Nicotiana tabacum TaxID=4097 RepID=A0AC58RXI3_TOBAC
MATVDADDASKHISTSYFLKYFWAPIITQGKCFLAVKDQPFGLSGLRIENTVKSTSKGVSRNGVLEFRPYVKFYTKNEYPLRDFAQDCGIGGYLALPILEPLGYNCVSVLEFVSICDGSYYLSDKIKQVSEKLKIYEFTEKHPGVQTLKSIDLSPASWMAVVWYPIYHVPMKGVIQNISTHFLTYHTLSASCQVQFWAPIITQGKCFLAFKDQPFGISDLRIENTVKITSKGYLLYASLPVFLQEPVFTARTREYKYSVDIGPLGKVFRNGVLEFCPYVKFYTKNEYPLRDFAQDCGIGGYLALPILEPLGYNCVSVLEFVSICDGSYYLSDKIKQVSEKLKFEKNWVWLLCYFKMKKVQNKSDKV